MSTAAHSYVLSPELLTFRDFTRVPPGVWLWPGGSERFARLAGPIHGVLAADYRSLAGLDRDRLEALHRVGILLDAHTLDTYTERVAAALGLLTDRCLVEAATELHRARVAAPALTTGWLMEAFTLLRAGARRSSRAILEQYLARWPGDPAATALVAAHEEGSPFGDQRGRVMVLAPSAPLAHELARRANACVERIRALCGFPPNPTVLVRVTETVEGGRCLRGGSPFARLIELSAHGVNDSTLLAHELVHATLSSGNLAFTEGLALHVSARLRTPWDDASPGALEWLAAEGDVDDELERLFLDLDTQKEAFDHTRQAGPRASGTMPRAHWLSFLGTTALVARVGFVPLVDYLQWLRDPTPAPVLATQEQLFRLYFGSSLRTALRSTGPSRLAR
jgi:hypothetical protein